MSTTTSTSAEQCDPATAVTRSLLGYGVIAGPLYVAVSLTQALTRAGFRPDPARVEPAGQRRTRAGSRSPTSS